MSNLSKFDPSFGASNTRYLIDGNDTITGYLKCDGSILSQTTYSSLFAKVGLIVNGLNTWTIRTPGTISFIRALTYSATDGLYVYGGDGGVLGTSTDAITWTRRTPGTISIIYALIYSATDGLYVYAGDGGTLGTSTNAITWTRRTPGTVSFILLSLILQQRSVCLCRCWRSLRHIYKCHNLDQTNPRYCFNYSCSHLR
jgi:hypothetical protein